MDLKLVMAVYGRIFIFIFIFFKMQKRMMVAIGFALYKADLWRFWKRDFWWWWKILMWRKQCHRIELTRVSFRALIPCRKPKSNRNNNEDKYIKRDEERKRREARVFQVVRLYEPTSTWCSQWATSLLYSLYDVIWMITMCCKVSYLYIELLVQLSYLTYVGFLNTVKTFSIGKCEILQIIHHQRNW